MSAAPAFAGTQQQVFADLQGLCNVGQRFASNQAGTQPAQPALPGARETRVQLAGNDTSEDGIAEEFQAFVVSATGTAMGQRLLKQ